MIIPTKRKTTKTNNTMNYNKDIIEMLKAGKHIPDNVVYLPAWWESGVSVRVKGTPGMWRHCDLRAVMRVNGQTWEFNRTSEGWATGIPMTWLMEKWNSLTMTEKLGLGWDGKEQEGETA